KVVVCDPEGGNVRTVDPNSQSLAMVASNPVQFGSFAMYRPGKFIVSGGGGGWSADAQGSTAVIDMNAPSPAWTATAPMSYPRYQHNLVVLADGDVMAGGRAPTLDPAAPDGALPSPILDPSTPGS